MSFLEFWDGNDPRWQLLCAYWQMDRSENILNLLRNIGEGVISEYSQRILLDFCIRNPISINHPPDNAYVARILKSVIYNSEREGLEVIDDIYSSLSKFIVEPINSSSFSMGLVNGGPGWCWKTFVYSPSDSMPLKKDEIKEEGFPIFSNKDFKFIDVPSESQFSTKAIRSSLCIPFPSSNAVNATAFPERHLVSLKVSSNLLQGGTGCCIWPAAFVLAEFILFKPEIVTGKTCLELGSGSGLVGICISRLPISRVILTDGDWETMTNLHNNLLANNIRVNDEESNDFSFSVPKVTCQLLQWENALESTLHSYDAGVILGADIIYDPNTNHYLTKVLSSLLRHKPAAPLSSHQPPESTAFEASVAYVAAAVRNETTLAQFIQLVKDNGLSIADEMLGKPCFEHLHDLNRGSIRIFRIWLP